jgi:hypothetical protein
LAAFGGAGAMCCMFGGYFGIIVLSMLAAIPANVATMRAELSNDLNQAMRFGDVLKFTKANFGVL